MPTKEYYQKHKDRLNSIYKEYRKANPGRTKENRKNFHWANRAKSLANKREWYYINRYNMTIAQIDEFYRQHESKCDICGIHQSQTKRSMNIDHNHQTGAVRGLLCGDCNRGIGVFKDDYNRLESAVSYLKKWR